jgi:protein gp37
MAENSKIEWTDHTFNPWIGCTKVSPACKNCYAERDMDHRYGRVAWGPGGTRVLTGIENWAKPVRWNMLAQRRGQSMTYGEAVAVYGKELPKCESHEWDNRTKYENNAWLREHGVDPLRRPRVFCASLADVFEDWQGPILNSKGQILSKRWDEAQNPDMHNDDLLTMNDVRTRLFALIDATPNLDWLLLTKRPENVRKMYLSQHLDGGTTGRIREFMDESESKDVNPYFRPNVWLGTSVENQDYADERIPELLKCRDLLPVLFLSCEPLLGPVDLNADGGWLVPWEKSDGVCGPDAWNEMFVCANNHSAKRYLKSEKHGRNICLQSGCEATVYPAKPGIDWVIAGGESGPEARPTDPEWFRSIRDQCQVAGVPFLFKQWGEFGENLQRVGKVRAGRSLDGVVHDGFPAPFRLQKQTKKQES